MTAVLVILDPKVIQGFKEKTEIMVLQEILASQGCLGCQDLLASKVTLEKKAIKVLKPLRGHLVLKAHV